VIEAGRLFARVRPEPRHAVELLDLSAGRPDVGGIPDVHMRDLVIGDREGARHPRVEQLARDRLLHGQ